MEYVIKYLLLSLLIFLFSCQLFSKIKGKSYFNQKSNIVNVTVSKVNKGEIIKTIFLNGQTKYRYVFGLVSKSSGEVVELLHTNGDIVSKGDVILKTDSKYLEIQKQGIMLKIKKAEINIEKQKTLYELKLKQYNNNIELSKKEIYTRKQNMLKVKSPFRKEELSEMKSNLKSSEAVFKNSEKNFYRIKKLYKKKSVSTKTYDETEAQYISSKSKFMAMKAKYNLILKGSRSEDLNNAKANLEIAKIKLKNLELDKTNISLMKKDIETSKISLLELKNNLAEINEKINDTVLRAPQNGILFNQQVSLGEVISQNKSVFMFAVNSSKEVQIIVSEDIFPKLFIGQSVCINLQENKIYSKIKRLIPIKNTGNSMYNAFCDVNISNDEFFSNQLVKCEVIISKKKNVLKILNNQILSTGSGKFVFCIRNKVAKKIRILTGIENDYETEITSNNLKPGDLVVLDGKEVLLGGEKVNIISKEK